MPQLTRLLPRRRYALLLALLLISSLLISALLFALTHRSKPDTLLLTRALDDCLSAESYSYQCRSTVTLGGDATERVFSVFSGEKAGEVIYSCDGEEIGRADVLFAESVEKIGFGGLLAKILQAVILV